MKGKINKSGLMLKASVLFKYSVLFAAGGAVYYVIEVLWRGHSYVSMAVTGGVCFILMGLINEILAWDTPLTVQMLIAACIVTAAEFAAGCILNLWLRLDIWDYSNMPLNLCGQICALYFALWYLLSAVGIVLDDYLRYRWFGERKPAYRYV